MKFKGNSRALPDKYLPSQRKSRQQFMNFSQLTAKEKLKLLELFTKFK